MNEVAKGIIQADFIEGVIYFGIFVLILLIIGVVDFICDVWGKNKK